MLKNLQREVNAWAVRNFQAWPHQPLLGIVEEVGELLENYHGDNGINHPAVEDAVGDAMIFVAHYCGMNGHHLEPILNDNKYSILFFGLQKTLQHLPMVVGRLCHAHLKLEQKIRTSENHRQNCFEGVAGVVGLLKCFCANTNIDFEKAVEKTWTKVKQRDWKKDPVRGGEVSAAKVIQKYLEPIKIKNIQKKSLPTISKNWKMKAR